MSCPCEFPGEHLQGRAHKLCEVAGRRLRQVAALAPRCLARLRPRRRVDAERDVLLVAAQHRLWLLHSEAARYLPRNGRAKWTANPDDPIPQLAQVRRTDDGE